MAGNYHCLLTHTHNVTESKGEVKQRETVTEQSVRESGGGPREGRGESEGVEV